MSRRSPGWAVASGLAGAADTHRAATQRSSGTGSRRGDHRLGGFAAPEVGRGDIRRLALRETLRATRAWLGRMARGPRLKLAVPTRLLFAPQDLRTSDPSLAHDIYGGYFVFAGRALQTAGASPFGVSGPSAAWREALYGFGWLRHLRAADTPLARENARALVTDAMSVPASSHPAESASVRVVTRRLISFLSQSPLLLTGADHRFYRRLMRSIGFAVRDLERRRLDASRPADRLWATIGLCYAGLCCEGYEAKLRRSLRELAAELDEQILPDGGHIGRNPGVLIDLLLDLLPLRQVFTSRGLEPPAALDRAIARMLPMVRLFRHGDGALALFNGMGRAALDNLATLVSYDAVRGEPAQHATYSGYDRVEAGATTLVADLGASPPVEASADAHAGCLSFELSTGIHRLVVNCGAPALGGPVREAARLTAAHSTLALGLACSATILGQDRAPDEKPRRLEAWLERRIGRVIVSGPRVATAERHRAPDGSVVLSGRHDGYRSRFGYLHERRLHLSANGRRLDGADSLIAANDRPLRPVGAVIRFHLHPAVEARRSEDHGVVLLRVGQQHPGRDPRQHDADKYDTRDAPEVWRFSLGAPNTRRDATDRQPPRVSVEDSVFFADADGRRPTRQIVVSAGGDATGCPDTIVWRLERVS